MCILTAVWCLFCYADVVAYVLIVILAVLLMTDPAFRAGGCCCRYADGGSSFYADTCS